ncbi:MAG: leucine-rich repeat domain-containing protein [Gemmatimonadetes bacterium]|nr:leucine-rich repeat domain-containing protein [Gemmatimonadota bacterium]
MSHSRKSMRPWGILAGVAWFVGCGDSTTDPALPDPPVPATITVSPETAELNAVGATVQLSAEVRDRNGRVMAGAAVTWVSTSTGVARVDAAGLVTSVGNGASTITATVGVASGSAEVTVAQQVRGIEVLPAPGKVSAGGDTLRLTADAWDPNGFSVPGSEFTWSSSDTAVATVDESGLVHGIVEGVAFITATTAGVSGEAPVTVAHQDWAPLAAFYQATQGPGWIEDDGWMSDRPIGQWHGVTTRPDGHVTALDLASSNLTGMIPTELGRLSHLETLHLQWNRLWGPIPLELTTLHNLRSLRLGVNGLTGEIPAELANLVNIEDLRLNHTFLTGRIPPDLSNLPNLTRLSIHGSDLTGLVPSSFVRFERLRLFHFRDNEDLCIPDEADFIRWLVQLDVALGPVCNEDDREALVSLYEATGGSEWTRSDGWLDDDVPVSEWHGVSTDSVGRVLDVDLSSNGLAGRLPELLAPLASMTSLRLDGNEGLYGPLPLTLSMLSLEALRYRNTGLCVPPGEAFAGWLAAIPSHEGTDAECSPLSDQEVLELLYGAVGGAEWKDDENWLSGQPLGDWNGVETDDVGRVVALRLPRNDLAGRIPPQLGYLEQLGELDLSGNQLEGPIPSQLGDLSSLTLMNLGQNELEGPIPPQLGDLTSLSQLLLWANELEGPIPPELGRLTNLLVLGLGINELEGPIPPQLGDLVNLFYLYLDGNRLSGPIPSQLGNLSRLSELILDRNWLTGSIPPWLGSLPNLTRLGLGHNGLTGSIPPELGNLPSLTELILGRNWLTGPVPSRLASLSALTHLDLSRNRLTGTIPSQLGALSSLERLNLSGNELAGRIPPDFGDLSRLQSLSIAGNRLSGALPPVLGGLTRLERLHLTDNADVSGILPSGLTALGELEELILTGTGLCAPADTTFQNWLSEVEVARVRDCEVDAGSSAYLTQAVQSLDFPVPLIAGREALLRVFAIASRPGNEGIPEVRASFYLDGVESHAVDIPGSVTPIPTEIEHAQSSLQRSANVTIPGSVIQPGLELVVEIDPDGTLDPELGVTKRIPAEGRAPVQVESLPGLDMTVIPFQWAPKPNSWIVDIAEGMAASPHTHEMLGDVRAMLPVADIDVEVHEAVLTSTVNSLDLLGETHLIRTLESGTRYYMGVLPEHVVGAPVGVAFLGFRISYSVADPFVIAHELGHNMGLYHAPCGGAGGPDPAFPQTDASIGSWGYDFRAGGSLVSPRARDLMSYCGPPKWVSEFSFTKALNHRLEGDGSQGPFAPTAPYAPTRSLILWGGVDDEGSPFLEPAFVADASPSLPQSSGDYELVGRSASGDELFSLSFGMAELADADGRSIFVIALPLRTEWAGMPESITLSGPGGSTTTDRTTDQPMAILRDTVSGEVRGILRGEDATDLIGVAADAVGLPGPRLQVLFSRGIPDG